jgi:hypothetical protein
VVCQQCGQKILIPTPPMAANKTTLGKLEDEDILVIPTAITAQPLPTPPPLPPKLPPSPRRELQHEDDFEDEFVQKDAAPQKHSGLGIASFLIALLVVGLDIIVVMVIAMGVAGSRERGAAQAQFLSGGMALVCLNCMSIPLCLLGGGLGLTGLIAHREQNNLFSWLGLAGNATIVLGVVGFYLFATLLGTQQR